jgi:hypothetical protein
MAWSGTSRVRGTYSATGDQPAHFLAVRISESSSAASREICYTVNPAYGYLIKFDGMARCLKDNAEERALSLKRYITVRQPGLLPRPPTHDLGAS